MLLFNFDCFVICTGNNWYLISSDENWIYNIEKNLVSIIPDIFSIFTVNWAFSKLFYHFQVFPLLSSYKYFKINTIFDIHKLFQNNNFNSLLFSCDNNNMVFNQPHPESSLFPHLLADFVEFSRDEVNETPSRGSWSTNFHTSRGELIIEIFNWRVLGLTTNNLFLHLYYSSIYLMVNFAVIYNIPRSILMRWLFYVIFLTLIAFGQQYGTPIFNSSLDTFETTLCLLRTCMCPLLL